MPTWKTTFFFESFQQSLGTGPGAAVGWTETWYQTRDGNIDQALMNAPVTAYMNFRRECLANIYRIAYVRVSDVDNPRHTKVRNFGQTFGTAVGDAAQVTCGILIDFTVLPLVANEQAHHRRFIMRGLTVNEISGNVINQQSPNAPGLMKFLNLVGNGLLGAPSLPAPATPYWQIRFYATGLDRGEITSLAVIEPAGHDIAVASPTITGVLGDQYLIRGAKFPYFLNRIWTDKGPSAGGARRLGKSRKHLSGTWDGSGDITALAYGYRGASQFLFAGLRVRHTGAPSHRTRGRRNPVV